jgi:hypothetical protein
MNGDQFDQNHIQIQQQQIYRNDGQKKYNKLKIEM